MYHAPWENKNQKRYAAISAFALHVWDNQYQQIEELTPEKWQEYRNHPSNKLIDYLTHRRSMLDKCEMLADLDCV